MDKLVYNDLFTGEPKVLKASKGSKQERFFKNAFYQSTKNELVNCQTCSFRVNAFNCKKIGLATGTAAKIQFDHVCTFHKL